MALVQRRGTTTATRTRTAPEEDEAPAARPRNAADRVARKKAPEPKFQEPEESDEGFEDEDEAPAERPRRGASKAAFKKGSSEGRSRPTQDEDEDDEPQGARSDAVQSGWGAANKLKKEGGNFANELSITKESQLVVFLDDAPYAVYKQHWIDGGLRSTKKKSFICMDKGCPLCAIGESAQKKWAFNVAALEDGDFVVYSLIAGSRLFDNIADEHEGDDGPLNEGFWTLSKSGVKQSTTYKLKKVEGRKLETAANMDEAEVEELFDTAELTPYTKVQHQPPSRSYLQEIADELTGADD
jgi:hypothetical protein